MENNKQRTTRQPGRSRLWPFVLLTIACAAAYCVGVWQGQTLANGGLTIEDRFLNFGTTWAEGAFRWPVTLKNDGSKAVEVLGFARSCSCAAVEPPSLTLEPEEQKTVTLVLDLINRPREGELFDTTIVPQIKGILSEPGWTFRGRVRKVLKVTPPVIDFEDITKDSSAWPTARVKVTSAVPLRKLTVDRPSDQTIVAIHQEDVQTFEVRVTPSSTLQAGRFGLDLVLVPEGETRLPRTVLPLKGMVYQEVEVIPEMLSLGALRIGTQSAGTVVFRSRSGKSFRVMDWQGPDGTQVTRLKTCTDGFEIRQDVASLGKHESLVVFAIKTGNGSGMPLALPLRVTYHGIAQ